MTENKDVDMPEDSVLDESEYVRMREVAATGRGSKVLSYLDSVSEATRTHLQREVTLPTAQVDATIDELHDAGLLSLRMGPDGEGGTYSYYTLTVMGEVIVERGVSEGIQELADRESGFADYYSS